MWCLEVIIAINEEAVKVQVIKEEDVKEEQK